MMDERRDEKRGNMRGVTVHYDTEQEWIHAGLTNDVRMNCMITDGVEMNNK